MESDERKMFEAIFKRRRKILSSTNNFLWKCMNFIKMDFWFSYSSKILSAVGYLVIWLNIFYRLELKTRLTNHRQRRQMTDNRDRIPKLPTDRHFLELFYNSCIQLSCLCICLLRNSRQKLIYFSFQSVS